MISTWCQFKLFAEYIELNFLTRNYRLALAHVERLSSAGKGHRRYLALQHHDPQLPATLHITPLHPARWYEAFEQLGLPTEDPVQLRESSQSFLRTTDTVSAIEGLFWMAVFGAAIVAGAISWLLG